MPRRDARQISGVGTAVLDDAPKLNSFRMSVNKALRRFFRRRFQLPPESLLGPPPPAGNGRWSAIPLPAEARPDPRGPEKSLLEFTLSLLATAKEVDLSRVLRGREQSEDAALLDVWPGEHYRLLAAMTSPLPGSMVVEVDAYRGAGTLALLQGRSTSVITHDVVPWFRIRATFLKYLDFQSRLEQRVEELSDPDYLVSQGTG